ncbi:hypothetical protein U9M48_017262 [Paspalum notatum var. saurae]|uniref:Uncharacterized protein n=1 Tax=Paspalum notatum var. saurae TaxID=547442 RepID=A0AAQ3TAK6_PASNO
MGEERRRCHLSPSLAHLSPSLAMIADAVYRPDSVEPSLAMIADAVYPPDSVEPSPDSVEEVPDSVVEVPDSVVEEPDVDEVVECPRCGTFHGSGVYGSACYQARRNTRMCTRCGLLHEDYDIPARFLYAMDKFDCEFFIPDVDKLVMSGKTIILPEQVVEKLEEKKNKEDEPKSSPQGGC